ncbi:MAG: DUF2206 domain-containing protein [Dehalococcoidia bacterium]
MIDNPINMNDWEIKKFLIIILALHVAMLTLVGLSAVGFDIPVLRQIVGFIYLTFLPGIIILRLLRLHNLGTIKTLLYSVGLSLASNMFLGFLVNMLYPLIGISKPISTLPLIITWTVVLGLLSFIAYRTDKGFFTTTHFKVGDLLSPPVLLLILLPILAVLGTQLVNFYQTNTVLMILICLIGLVAVLAMLTKFIPERLYPLAIYGVALALLWHFSLVSQYLVQFDSFLEYHFFGLVTGSGHWDWAIAHNYNSMLSITILPATFSQLLGMSGTALFKVIYPIWYALVPLGLYSVYSKQFSSKQAFLAAFFFMSIQVYYLMIPSINRQMVAELFCVLLIILIMDRETTGNKKPLFVIFIVSLVVSHYSLSYLYICFFLLSLIILHLLREKSLHITSYSVALFIVICLAWYMYISSSSPLETILNTGKHIYQTFSIEFLNPFSRDLSYILMRPTRDTVHLANKLLWYLIVLFMAVGVTKLVSNLRRREVNKEYATMAVGNYFLLGACIAIPFLANSFGSSRMFHIASLILAPFCVLGAEIIFGGFSRAIQFIRHSPSRRISSAVPVAALLVLFFLFNTTLPFEIANSSAGRSFPLSLGHIRSGDKAIELGERIQVWSSSPTAQEVSSAEWLDSFRNEKRPIYATYWQMGVPTLVSYGMIPPKQTYNLTPLTTVKDIGDSYVYLGYVNVVLGYGTTTTAEGQPDVLLGNITHWDISQITPLLDSSTKVYTNGASEIYWSPE